MESCRPNTSSEVEVVGEARVLSAKALCVCAIHLWERQMTINQPRVAPRQLAERLYERLSSSQHIGVTHDSTAVGALVWQGRNKAAHTTVSLVSRLSLTKMKSGQ